MPIRDFSGALCVVTGAACGLGAALARGLAAQGCRVALVDVDPRVHDVAATPLGVNPWGAWRGCRAFLPHLRRHREAHVVNVASAFVLHAPPGSAPTRPRRRPCARSRSRCAPRTPCRM